MRDEYSFWALIIIIVVGYLLWSEIRDDQMMTNIQAYEECIKKDYGMSPLEYEYKFGELPPPLDCRAN